MNRETNKQAPQGKATQTRIVDEANDPALHPVTRKNLKRNKKRQRTLQIMMIALVCMILISGLMLAIMPLFTVSEIVVEGNNVLTAEEIIDASGIRVGDEIFGVALGQKEIKLRIFDEHRNLRTIKISCGLSKVTITVTEMENVMYASAGSTWYSVNADMLVLEKNADPSAFSRFLKVKLPSIAGLAVGAKLTFSDPSVDYSYINGFLDALKAHGVMDKVTYVDFSNKLALSCVFGDQIRLELGALTEVDKKFEKLASVLSRQGSMEGYAVIDVSNPSEATLRPIEASALYE